MKYFWTFLLLSFFCLSCNNEQVTQDNPQNTIKKNPDFIFVPSGKTILTGGLLADRYQKNVDNLYLAIDKEELKNIYAETHDPWYAEPEFLGHWLTAGPLLYAATKNEEIPKRNNEVLEAVFAGQRDNGYLGTYHEGLEFDYTFSVWNQNFMIKGLVAQYEATGNEKALEAATKCADYIANAYLQSDTLDLLFGLNQGIQHATILEEMAHLYMITGKKLYLDFAEYIVKRLENSSIQVVSIPNKAEFWAINFMMGCTKGIEMFNIYFGILQMYQITGDDKYLTAAKNYWRNLKEIQIRITGNGTIGENWNHLGNTPIDLTNDMRPNENCVAMGWMKFNAELSQFSGESVFFDEFEKTLYNHLVGSQALDGHDFSYYQGNIGHKIHEKDPGAYSCCRYRGMRILSYLPGYVYMQNENSIAVNLYTTSMANTKIKDTGIQIDQETNYPRTGKVTINVKPEKDLDFQLLLRKPEWCENYTVKIGEEIVKADEIDGYLVIDRSWTTEGTSISLDMEMKVQYIEATVNGEPRVAVKYGPLVLAIDSRYGTPVATTRILSLDPPALHPVPVTSGQELPMVMFETTGKVNGKEQPITLVDYASAGSLDPGVDEFRVWLPVN